MIRASLTEMKACRSAADTSTEVVLVSMVARLGDLSPTELLFEDAGGKQMGVCYYTVSFGDYFLNNFIVIIIMGIGERTAVVM